MRQSRSRLDARAGMVLIEVLAYAGILALLINAIIAVMTASARLNAMGTATLDRLRIASDIRDSFSRDVRAAASVADSALDYQTGPERLVLELPPLDERAGARHFVVYGRLKSEHRLDRMEFTVDPNGQSVIESFLTFPVALEGFRVDHAPQSRMASVEIDADQTGNRPLPKGLKRKPPVTYRFSAALRSIMPKEGGAS